jgi:ketosteroid isomerase-like protein
MSAENVAIIKSMYAAFAAGDGAALLAGMSPDIVWNEAENFPYADNNPYRGPAAVAAGVFARCASEWDGFAVKMDDLIDGGDRVVALGRYGGAYKASGRAMNPQAVHVWTLKDGKATAFQQYVDTLDVARAMGTAAA